MQYTLWGAKEPGLRLQLEFRARGVRARRQRSASGVGAPPAPRGYFSSSFSGVLSCSMLHVSGAGGGGGLLEGGEADRVLVEGERGVDVLHEAVAEEPDVAAEADVLARERADALARAGRGLAEAEAVKCKDVNVRAQGSSFGGTRTCQQRWPTSCRPRRRRRRGASCRGRSSSPGSSRTRPSPRRRRRTS